jgi:hypothetical protein
MFNVGYVLLNVWYGITKQILAQMEAGGTGEKM